ncbi:alpha-L-arabinofuranosidase [Flavobacterium rivuli WB 3.3-2 = DSM 21788]|uniref:non-reducing end alpha-L-arabinofuranosidase n=1 Tax=Flavobacterium rivuli WB 3.3-2 = DSM 21788 TaxID=1121895 RepID=A0A0A2M6P9_9FLAO|nr:alpha-L-arabinofuranosidase C-terminal domain-containing protein [Flavobacterium rivuli]KGO87964.1 alpha-L-arabinofuranosidase [Flavobacterium rivuli WB 3.3-2 = DSM 21788]
MITSKKQLTTILLALLMSLSAFAGGHKANTKPEKVFLFAYATDKDKGHNGLHFAWSSDKKNWHAIGPEHSFLRCDYGRWGSEKRMLAPYLFKAQDGMWHAVWALNEKSNAFAHAASADLINWKRQSYPIMMPVGSSISQPEVSEKNGVFTVTCLNTADSKFYTATTKDFKNYTATTPATKPATAKVTASISGKTETGTVTEVSWQTAENLIKTHNLSVFKNKQNDESSKDDAVRFANLKPVEGTITLKAAESKKISDMLVGVFFEDINYAADGGLYAELVQNRDFEYALSDKEGRDKDWNSTTAWSLSGGKGTLAIDSVQPIHANNKHYAILKSGAAIINSGYDGIAVKAGDSYDFSIFAKNIDGKASGIKVRLIGANGEVYGETSVKGISTAWKKISAVLKATKTVADARLEVVPQTNGTLAVDMISLFPQKTYKGRKNGLRADLAQTVADLHPKFMRFPGGCVAHGDGLGNIYRWKNTIGPLESRKPLRNLWGYHQTTGLGYFEYFQYCEDMGAAPLPVIAAGVPCQNSAIDEHIGLGGQQCGVPMEEMGQYVQDILDLVEYANGPVTSKWGKLRAEAGHPKPFNLKYVGIGNEDLITDLFEERYAMIVKAMKDKHPEITVIGTVGPAAEGTDYEEGWALADKLDIPMVDEHYYQPVGWFINNQDYYDRYDRSKSKVYLGEYAAFLPGRPNNIETALAEALYLTALERNGDVVSMTSYAPMLAKENHTQWNPDLIYFNNTEVKPTVGYYTQQLYGQNAGDVYLPSDVALKDANKEVSNRVAVSVVRDSKSKDLIVKIVNMLPVAVNSIVNLEGAGAFVPSAKRYVLTGTPDSKTAKPVADTITVGTTFPCAVPAYSFTLIRIKTK